MVDDVDIAVVLKLDAEVTDRKDRFDRLVGHMAIVTLELDIAQGSKASGEGLGLLLVGANGVGDQQVGLAALGGIGRIQGGGGSSGHGVGNALGEDVERQAGDHDGQAREQRLPPTAGEHAAAGVGEDVAPGSGGSWIPAPMKVSEASKMMASATRVTVKTMIGAMQLRRTCLIKIHGALAPETMTART